MSHTRILVVDDQFEVRQLVSSALRAHNMVDVQMLPDGRQAREVIYAAQAARRPFDVVFLDWEMPSIEGIDLLKHFREQPAFNNTAFVMLTSKSLQAEVMDAIKSGATAYMTKPVSAAAINKKFAEILAWLKQRKTSAA